MLHDNTRYCGPGVKKMFWAAFNYDRHTGLVPMNSDPMAPRSGITARIYRDVLAEHLPTIADENSIFMQDRAGIHCSILIRNFLLELGITRMIWPPYSPDLNPIENLWSVLKQLIYEQYPKLEHADDTVETLERLIAAAIEV
ncbi:hypothetical protein V493_02566 [Pseudogymnoascus sp. VKM F-4281 (FW-2241)]|nr:hypothetical protein V493_02566 [Pseudogymnoascus sp. VKM F-4281 (FW-2241)]